MDRKKILFYDDEIYGHHLEYIHHLHERAAREGDKDFVFVCPERFKALKGTMNWTAGGNISFDFLSEDEYEAIRSCYRKSFARSAKALNIRVKRHSPEEVFLLVLDQVVPFDLFYVRGGVKISGIIYGILPLMERDFSWRRRLVRRWEYGRVLRKDRYKSLYVLNSQSYADHFNALCHSDKFKYLTDPVTLGASCGKSLREELGIPAEDRVFLHPGAMRSSKGTLDILDAIAQIPEASASGCHFIFAGRIQDDIKAGFYRKYEALKDRYKLLLRDGFLGYETLASLYKTCDIVLTPYHPSVQSSGIVGHAALFHKPLIVLKDGFAGRLVEENRLGMAVRPSGLAEAILHPVFPDFAPDDYVRGHSVEEFTRQIFQNF